MLVFGDGHGRFITRERAQFPIISTRESPMVQGIYIILQMACRLCPFGLGYCVTIVRPLESAQTIGDKKDFRIDQPQWATFPMYRVP